MNLFTRLQLRNGIGFANTMLWLGIAVAVAYIPGLTGAAISTTWAFLLIVIPFLIFKKDTLHTNFHYCFLAFVLYSVITLFFTPSIFSGLFTVAKLFMLYFVFC